ncbi:activator of hsp90 atpase 1 family protein [Apiospora kogelbergensis]|uniref:activator of hsp90 atpase 1 family protein n=1 Tax=Apiospora kogelbergensis TaxID=1337665 RepID=UPI00312E0C81
MNLFEPIYNRCEIEIRAPPALVHSVLLDFDRYRDWTHTSRWAITTDKKVQDLKPGDVIRVDLGGMSFRPALVGITDNSLTWDGSLWGLLTGRHFFHVLPSETTPGSTVLVQKEEWTGPLSVPFRLGKNKHWDHGPGWDRFNEDIKAECERRSS